MAKATLALSLLLSSELINGNKGNKCPRILVKILMLAGLMCKLAATFIWVKNPLDCGNLNQGVDHQPVEVLQSWALLASVLLVTISAMILVVISTSLRKTVPVKGGRSMNMQPSIALAYFILVLCSNWVAPTTALNGNKVTAFATYSGWRSFEVITQRDQVDGYIVPGQFDGIGVSRVKEYI